MEIDLGELFIGGDQHRIALLLGDWHGHDFGLEQSGLGGCFSPLEGCDCVLVLFVARDLVSFSTHLTTIALRTGGE